MVAHAIHTDEAAVVVVLTATHLEAGLVRVATAVTAESSWRTRASSDSWVAAKHGDAGAVLGATKRDHMLADVSGDNLATLRISVGEDVLDEVVAELVTSNVDERHARTIRTSLTHDVEVAIKEVRATDLEALLDHLGGELIHAVLGSKANNVINGASAIRDSAMLADMLDAPVAELAVRDDIDAGENLVDAGTLVVLKTVLEDVLDNKAASLAQSNLMPHAAQSLVDVLHDLRRRAAPTQFEQLLPNVASVAVDDGLGNAKQELVDHDGLVLFRDAVECLLDNVTPKSIHAETEGVAANGLGNGNDLLRRAVLEAALDQEVAKAVDHERVGLINNRLHDLELLLGRSNFDLLLQEDGSLLIIVANDLVDDVAPVAAHVAVEKATIVERLDSAHVVLRTRRLGELALPLTSEVRGSRREARTDGRLNLLSMTSRLVAVDLVELRVIEVLVQRGERRRSVIVAARARSKGRGRTEVRSGSRSLTAGC